MNDTSLMSIYRMKKKFYKILQKQLQKFGVYTQYYASDRAIHYHLKSKPIVIQNYELNKVSKSIQVANNHSFYQSLLRKFVPDWDIKIEAAQFIFGAGMGASSLDCYRRVNINGNSYFEKVYFSEHDDLKRIKWFHLNAYNSISRFGITAPALHNLFEGKAFVITYFQFLDLLPLVHSEVEENFISISKKLYLASLEEHSIKDGNDIPEYVKSFQSHFEYKNKLAEAKHKLTGHGVDFQEFEKAVKASKLIFTHGDIQEKNAFKNSMIIDFDTFGIYPIGFDVAFCCFRLLITDKIQNLVPEWLENNFKKDIKVDDWEQFDRNFTFFLFVFLATYFKRESYTYLEERLAEKIKYYNRH